MTGHNTSNAIRKVRTRGYPPGRTRLGGRGGGGEHHEQTQREGKTVGGQIEEGDTKRTGENEPGDEETEEKRGKPRPRGRKEGKEEGTKPKEPRRAGKTNTEEKVRKMTNGHLGGNRRENTRGEGRA